MVRNPNLVCAHTICFAGCCELGSWASQTRPCQVNVKVSHHVISADGDKRTVNPESSLVFVLDIKDDEPKKKPKGKKGKKNKQESDVSFRNFGAKLSLDRMKQGSKLVLGWRCRRGSAMNSGYPPCVGNKHRYDGSFIDSETYSLQA